MRNAALVILLGSALALNGCGGSSTGGTAGASGKGGAGGGSAGTTGGAGASGSTGTTGGAGASGSIGTTGSAGVSGHGGGSAGAAGSGATGAGGGTVCGDATGLGSGATCNAIAASGACVTSTLSSATVPTPGGGVFVAGTYNLVSQTDYGTADGGFLSQTGRQTVALSNVTSTSFTLDQIETSGTIVARTQGTVSVSGMTATFSRTCPPPKDAGTDSGESAKFTATLTSITLFEENNGLIQVSVYARTL